MGSAPQEWRVSFQPFHDSMSILHSSHVHPRVAFMTDENRFDPIETLQALQESSSGKATEILVTKQVSGQKWNSGADSRFGRRAGARAHNDQRSILPFSRHIAIGVTHCEYGMRTLRPAPYSS
jgi:hypothetical protein